MNAAESIARATGSVSATVINQHRDPATGELVTDSTETWSRPVTTCPECGESVTRAVAGHGPWECVNCDWSEDPKARVARMAVSIKVRPERNILRFRTLHQAERAAKLLRQAGITTNWVGLNQPALTTAADFPEKG